jgi:VIT1/CCC1 family predicted Fe2+/Mn2+ transporter
VQSLSGRIFRKTRQKFFGSPCANQGALAARNGRDGISNAIQNSEKQHERIEDDRLSGVRIMITQRRHAERHRTDRIGWLRAAVLGANDGIVSTASLVVGVAAASTSPGNILLTGVAGLVAGAMAMAAGEYVSVHSQSDTEKADLARERAELEADPVAENRELTAIYVARGLEPALAQQVADQLMRHDALGAHSRDELGISAAFSAQPVQAALASAGSFAFGAALPLAVTAFAPAASLIPWVSGTSIVFLALLGAVSARAGGAGMLTGAWRVTFWGALAMVITAGVGSLFGAVV